LKGNVNTQGRSRWLLLGLLLLALGALALPASASAGVSQGGSDDDCRDDDRRSGGGGGGGEDGGGGSSGQGGGGGGSGEFCDDDDDDGEDENRRIVVRIRRDDEDDRRVRDRSSSNNGNDVSSASTDLNCSDFSSRRDAQNELDSSSSDTHNLDADNDGVACEDIFTTQDVSGDDTPQGGVETGGGGTLEPQLASNDGAGMAAQVGRALAIALAVGGLLFLRRTRSR
jgi:hypothetical protein